MKFALCKNAEELPEGDEWIFQPKLDGARCLAIDGDLYNRPSGADESGRRITDKFPEIDAPDRVALDGEIVAEGGFGRVVGRVNLEDPFDIEMRSKTNPAKFMAFDLLAKGDLDVRSLPLEERLQLLSEIKGIQIVPTVKDGRELFREVKRKGGEGVIAKRLNSPYPQGRSDDWLKIKNWKEEVFPILGYEITRKGGFVIRIPVQNDVQRVVVNGERDQRMIKEKLDSGEELKGEIQYLSKKNGSLRAPSFKRLHGNIC